jgi:hypothetical protein
MKKIIATILVWVYVISLGGWMFGSFIEINIKNREPNPQYNETNFFIVVGELVDSWKD